MKKVAIVGLGWLGMPLAMSLATKGWQVTGSKTTADGVEAARMCGIDGIELRLEPELVCDADDLDALMNVDALVITLPARRSGPGESFYLQAMQEIVDSALAHHIPRIIFTSSTSVYGDVDGLVKETTVRRPVTASGQCLKSWKTGCTIFPVLRLILCVWQGWLARDDIRDVFLPGSQPLTDNMASISCILTTLSAQLSYSYRLQKVGTSIIYVRLLIQRVARFIR